MPYVFKVQSEDLRCEDFRLEFPRNPQARFLMVLLILNQLARSIALCTLKSVRVIPTPCNMSGCDSQAPYSTDAWTKLRDGASCRGPVEPYEHRPHDPTSRSIVYSSGPGDILEHHRDLCNLPMLSCGRLDAPVRRGAYAVIGSPTTWRGFVSTSH